MFFFIAGNDYKTQKGCISMKNVVINKKICFFLVFAILLSIFYLPNMKAYADDNNTNTCLLNRTMMLQSGNSTNSFDVDFEAGKTYTILATWESLPTFSGNYTGWRIDTMLGQTVKDMIIKTDKKNDTTTDSSIESYCGTFVALNNATSIRLTVNGLSVANTINIQINSEDEDSNVLFEAIFTVAQGTRYLNCYFDIGFLAENEYCITAEWNNTPTYTGSTTAWKIQATDNEFVDGNGTVIYRATRDTSTGTSNRDYSGIFTPDDDIRVFNFFTQSINNENVFHVKIEKNILNVLAEIHSGNEEKNYEYGFELGKAYLISAVWTDTPVYTGALQGWSISTYDEYSNVDLIIKTAKKNSETGNGNLSKSFTCIYVPTEDAIGIKITSTGLVTSNSIYISVEPTTAVDDVLLDAYLSVEDSTEYLSAYFDLAFESGQAYDVTAEWENAPVFTSANEGKTAWKVQSAQDDSVAGDDTIIYKTTAANRTASQEYSGTFQCIENQPVFNFFTQRVDEENSIHFTIEVNNDPIIPLSFIADQCTAEYMFSASSYLSGHVMQGFDIFNDTVFVCYDEGYCSTYDINTGSKIADFSLGSSINSNHCGNVNFGEEYPTGNTSFPALYVSGDLTTKACYVENVSTCGSQLIQTIYFDINPSYTGGQVVVDKDRDRLIYMQRLNSAIRDLNNVFKIYEFRIPALSEGTVVRFDNDDILSSYDLSYYSPLYQGATIYSGALLQTHGYQINGFGSYVGLMYFDVQSHQFDRHIDLSNIVSREPQGVTVYNEKLIMNFSGGVFYCISLNINIPTTGYEVNYGESEEEFAYNIADSVGNELSDGFYINDVDNVEIDYDNESFSADIYVQTPYCEQMVTISGMVIIT